MKIEHGNIVTSVTKGVILQQVNCQGVMGSGVAAAIRGKWPVVFTAYREKYDAEVAATGFSSNLLGKAQVIAVGKDLFVVNLFSQNHFGRDGRRYTSYDALDEALHWTKNWANGRELKSSDIHHPAIGSGLGGGSWPIVASIITEHLGDDTTLWLYP